MSAPKHGPSTATKLKHYGKVGVAGTSAAVGGIRDFVTSDMDRIEGARFMSSWEEIHFLNAFNKGFILDGTHARLSQRASYRNVVEFAGVGKGKSTTSGIPNIFGLFPASQVIVDLSEELYKQTAGRLAQMGYDVQVFNLADSNSGLEYNPLHSAETYLECYRAANTAARTDLYEGTQAAFWHTGAAEFIQFSADCLKNHPTPNMDHLRNIRTMAGYFYDPIADRTEELQAVQKFVSMYGSEEALSSYISFSQGAVDTLLGQIKTASTQLAMFGIPEIAAKTAGRRGHTFNFQQLRNPERPTALFIQAKELDMSFYGPLLNLFFSDMIRQLTLPPRPEERDVFMILDEFGHHPIPAFPEFAATARKYRIGFWIMLQSASQLADCYGETGKETIIRNTTTKIYHGGGDIAEAKEIERRIGQRKIPMEQQGKKVYHEETLLSEAEVIRIPTGEKLIMYDNQPPIRLKTTPFYENPQLKAYTEIPPPPIPRHPSTFPCVEAEMRSLAPKGGRIDKMLQLRKQYQAGRTLEAEGLYKTQEQKLEAGLELIQGIKPELSRAGVNL